MDPINAFMKINRTALSEGCNTYLLARCTRPPRSWCLPAFQSCSRRLHIRVAWGSPCFCGARRKSAPGACNSRDSFQRCRMVFHELRHTSHSLDEAQRLMIFCKTFYPMQRKYAGYCLLSKSVVVKLFEFTDPLAAHCSQGPITLPYLIICISA